MNRNTTLFVQDKTQEKAWSGQRSAIGHLRIFRCLAHAHTPIQKRKKLDEKREKCISFGNNDHSEAHKLHNPITKKIIISRDVIFYEAEF